MLCFGYGRIESGVPGGEQNAFLPLGLRHEIIQLGKRLGGRLFQQKVLACRERFTRNCMTRARRCADSDSFYLGHRFVEFPTGAEAANPRERHATLAHHGEEVEIGALGDNRYVLILSDFPHPNNRNLEWHDPAPKCSAPERSFHVLARFANVELEEEEQCSQDLSSL
jgi:hypothetical protein